MPNATKQKRNSFSWSQIKMGNIQTDFLFAQPSALSGAARLLDLSGLFDTYNNSKAAGEADIKALLSDWYIVGQDFRFAIKEEAGQ